MSPFQDRSSAVSSVAVAPPEGGASTVAPAGIHVRILKPSLIRYSPALIFLAIMIADSSRYAGPDLWGHLRFGLDYLAAGHLIRHDPYSYSAANHLWRDHEWLCEVVMALFYKGMGVAGLKLWRLLCTAATIIFLVLALAETGASTLAQLAIVLAAAVAIAPQVQYRPQVFTFALLSALLALLARHRYRGRAPLWLAIPLLALWANLHGGFVMGLATLGIYAGVVLLQDLWERAGARRGLGLIGLTIAASVATLANPYGIGMWETVLHALHNPFTRHIVTDWEPFGHAMLAQWHLFHPAVIYYVLALALVAALAWSVVRVPRGGDLPLIAIAAVMVASAFFAARNTPLAVIACCIPLAHHIGLAQHERGAEAAAAPSRSPMLNQVLFVAVGIALAIQSGLFSRLSDAGQYPAGAVAFMNEHKLSGNVLDDFDWGEYLIWWAPKSKVFIDGRYDTVYPAKVIRDYIAFRFDSKGGATALTDYRDDLALVKPHSGAFAVISRQKGWKLIYHDSDSALFAPVNSPAAASAAAPVIGHPGREYFPR